MMASHQIVDFIVIMQRLIEEKKLFPSKSIWKIRLAIKENKEILGYIFVF